jgi:hypothetical protein
MTIAKSFIAVSEHNGIHIPKIFVRGYEQQFLTYKDKEKLKEWVRAILEEEDHDDEWIRLLENARLIIEGKEYTLWQDGDVHAFPCDKHIQWVPNEEELSDNLLDEMYKEMLDLCYQQIEICGNEYAVSRVLKEVDPIAYRCRYVDWLDSEIRGKNITEHRGKYYDGDVKIPENFSEYIGDPDEYAGHFEWKKVTHPFDVKVFESDIPAHQTMENH